MNSSTQPSLNLPCQDPLDGIDSVMEYVPLVHRPLNWEGCPAWKLLSIILVSIAKLPRTEIYDIMRGPAEPVVKDENPNTPTSEKGKYPWRVLFLAAETGNIVFIYEVIRLYPELLLEVNDNNQSIFHVAVACRHEDIFSLIYEVAGSTKACILTLEDKNGNNMLHLAGILTERARRNCLVNIPGSAQKLQRELILFQEVRSMLPISFRDKRNVDGFTPDQEFNKHHQYLVDEDEKMMEETGAHLMVVAALSATTTFAVAGYPVLRNDFAYSVNMIFGCISFLLASASIVNILSLLACRYPQLDFLTFLPNKWLTSVLTIYYSIATMMVAYVSNLDILIGRRLPVLSSFLECTTIIILCYTGKQMLYIMAPFLRNGISRYDRRSMPSYYRA